MAWMWLEATVLLVVGWRLRLRLARLRAECKRERRMREELEAYARLDASPALDRKAGRDVMAAERALARRVCCTVAEKSVFRRVGLLLRTRDGRLACAGSVGMDDLTLAAVHAWGEQRVAEERVGRGGAGGQARSFWIQLGSWGEFDRGLGSWALTGKRERRQWRRGLVAPIRTGTGRMAGAIVVCADGAGIDGPEGWSGGLAGAGVLRAMGPIETLAARLSATLENETLSERLLRAEKLAGLGQLAGGVAHALNNPLTAVLGFAELIAETAGEARVQQDARTIQLEALKMKETVGRLVEFWRPASRADERVDVVAMLRELSAACSETLRQRGVELELSGVAEADGREQATVVRGSTARLRQVMEHLLNNAAQAIAGGRPREEDEGPHAIRITVSHDERAVHVIVGDTGPGFAEPGRVFDPFYTTKGPEQGAGLGLSICYGIVREHGGEISAFNLHPHGAAVVVELPVGRVLAEEAVIVEETPALVSNRVRG